VVESGGTVPIFKTEVIDNNLNPKWRPLCLNFQQFGSKVSVIVVHKMSDVTPSVYMDYSDIF
jgi:hypothetical protein